jgi:hypothetical protein
MGLIVSGARAFTRFVGWLTPTRIAAGIGGITAILIAINALMIQIPAAIENYRKAHDAIVAAPTTKHPMNKGMPSADGLRSVGMQPPMASKSPAPSIAIARQKAPKEVSTATEDATDQPIPPGCRVVPSTDYAVFPPQTTRSVQCN